MAIGLLPGNPLYNGLQPNHGAPSTDELVSLFQGTPYADSPVLQQILGNYRASGAFQQIGNKGDFSNRVREQITQYANTFSDMFKNKVGRDPTTDDYNAFFREVVQPDQPWGQIAPIDNTKFQAQTNSTLSDFFSSAAQQEATKKLQDLSAGAVAPGSAFDQWQKSYLGSVGGLQQNLIDYQSRLMDKIRPQLITSLKSQGLLDTGGLNEAFAGVTGDLTNTAGQYSAQAQAQAQQDIANTKLGIQQNPTNFQIGNTMQNPSNLMAGGQGALNNIWNSYLSNQNYNQQSNLMGQQNDYNKANQPSLLQQYGGMILGGAAGGAGQGIAKWAMA